MVTHVIRSEGTVFEELVERRIARVHGLRYALKEVRGHPDIP